MKKDKVTYTSDNGEMDDFDHAHPLTLQEQAALGIPTPAQARDMRMVRRPAKETRINVRLSSETLAGLKTRAAELGMPYQTLAASVLHMVATGKLRLELVSGQNARL